MQADIYIYYDEFLCEDCEVVTGMIMN